MELKTILINNVYCVYTHEKCISNYLDHTLALDDNCLETSLAYPVRRDNPVFAS